MKHPLSVIRLLNNAMYICRMDSLPSANMRQHKLDQQRRLIEEKQRQKRAQQNMKIGQCSWGPVTDCQ